MWRIEFDRRAFKDLRKLGGSDQRRVRRFIDERLLPSKDPRRFGKALTGQFANLWRYRVGDVRIIAQIIDERFVVLVVSIGNRREIYR